MSDSDMSLAEAVLSLYDGHSNAISWTTAAPVGTPITYRQLGYAPDDDQGSDPAIEHGAGPLRLVVWTGRAYDEPSFEEITRANVEMLAECIVRVAKFLDPTQSTRRDVLWNATVLFVGKQRGLPPKAGTHSLPQELILELSVNIQ